MADHPRIARLVVESAWAMLPSSLHLVYEIVGRTAKLSDAEIDARISERRDQVEAARQKAETVTQSGGGVAVLPIYGAIVPRADAFTEISGGTSTEAFTQALRQMAADPSISAIVLDIDSPGGMVAGVPELAAEIFAARSKKPIIAVANWMAASAAYWLAAQASELVVAPSGQVGSIGVYIAHTDISGLQEKAGLDTTLISAGKFKVEGNPYEPLSEEAAAAKQKEVDHYYGMFVTAVAKGRGVDEASVRNGFGEGRMVTARNAVSAGMADRVDTLDGTISRLMGSSSRSSRPASGGSLVDLADLAAYAEAAAATSSTATLEAVSAQIPIVVAGSAGQSAAADRPQQPTVNDHEKESTEMPEVVVPEPAEAATPRQVDPARDDLNTVVAELATAVTAMNEGRTDRETVEKLTEEVVTMRAQLDAQSPRSGYLPGDETPGQNSRGPLTAAQLQTALLEPSARAAVTIHRPVEQVAAFQETSDNLVLLAAALRKDPRETSYYGDQFLPALGALDTVTVAEGSEFVPTILSGDLIQRVELALKVAALFREVTMPSNPFEIPGFAVTRVRGGKAVQNTADTGQTGFKKITPGTRKIVLTAAKFAAEVLVSKEEEEDSLIAILPFLRQEIVSQLAYDFEDTIINGDTTATHMDADVTAADDPRKNFNGLRKLALAAAKTDGGNVISTAAALRLNRKKMGKYGVDSSQLVHLVGVGQYVNLLSDTNLLTVDKFGPDATILKGELAKIDGIPILVSEYVRSDLNATGVQDGVTTNRSEAITVNTNCFLQGTRRGLTTQLLQELYAEYDQDALTVSMRKAFAAAYPTASEPIVAITYNLAA